MRKPVTTDVSVLQGWPKGEKPVASADVAKALGITVFQITARLKGMEGRGFVIRANGLWKKTEAGVAEAKNPSPSVVKAGNHRKIDALGVASGPPDDSHVPLLEVGREQWVASEDALAQAKKRLPQIEERMASLDKKEDRKEWLTLQVERDHCSGIVKQKRSGKWTLRRIRQGSHTFDLYVAPDGREYVRAENHEVADMRIAMPTGFDPARLRLFTTSALSRRAARAEKEATGRAEAKKTNGAPTNGQIADTEPEAKRSKAEAAFWKLPAVKRDKIRATGKYESYEDWYEAAKAKRAAGRAEDAAPATAVKTGSKKAGSAPRPGGKAVRKGNK